MYQKLIDTVSSIVKAHGVGILSDSRFWNILTDSYPFGSDYSLRDTFKKCIADGYVSEIVSLKGKSQKTIDKIKDVVAKEHKTSPTKDGEYIAILFSIAIAIGSCSKKDYQNFQKTKNSSSPSNPPTRPSNNSSNSWQNMINLLKKHFLLVLFGLFSTLCGTVLYGLYFFGGWWMFFVLILIGLLQLGFCAYALNSIDQAKNKTSQNEIASLGIPFCLVFLVNTFMSLLFQGDDFRRDVYQYFSSWRPQIDQQAISSTYLDETYYFSHHILESPGFFSVLLCLLLLFCFGACGLGLFNIKNPRSHFKLKECLFSLSLILLVEGGLFLYPLVRNHIQKIQYSNSLERINRQIKDQEESNNILIKSRAAITQDLSFKGIRLGISYDTALGYASEIIDSASVSGILPDKITDEYFYTYFREEPNIMETLTQAYTSYTSKENDEHEWFCGKLIQFETTLDNQSVSVRVFEREGLVYAISVVPKYGSSHGEFNDFSTLVKLYTQKYGEPELIREKSYYEYPDYHSDDTMYNWTFRNGVISLTDNYITYVPSSFFLLAKEIAEKKQREYEEAERIRKYHEYQQDSIKRAEQRADSIRKAKNHQNAINEI